MTFVKVKNSPFVRDINTMALLNTDRKVISKDEAYKREMQKEKLKNEEIQDIKNEIAELKKIMKQLLDKVEDSNG
jgi:hypothetical protein